MILPDSPAFEVPALGYDFDDRILRRSLSLIDKGIWAGLSPVRLRRWMRNFETKEDRYFAACVLDSLIYRSDDQTTALLLHLFQRSLVDATRQTPTNLGPVKDWIGQLRSSQSPIRLVVAVKQTDSPHKSAHLVSRLLKRQLSVRQDWITKPWNLREHVNAGARVLVFIDDFLGTGSQFRSLLRAERLDWIFDEASVIYAPFVAHTAGVNELRARYPRLTICAAELLDSTMSIFAPDNVAFRDDFNSPASALAFYYSLLERKGLCYKGKNRLGHGGLGLTYAFQHGVPNNNLPLLWASEREGWMPLFDR